MLRHRSSPISEGVSTSALDLFANAVGALAFLLLMFAVNSLELVRPSALKILTSRVPVSRAGTDYLAVLAAAGGQLPYRWTIETGTLPEGLVLDADRGEIVGAPDQSTAGRDFPVEVEVADGRARRTRARFELRVLPREAAARASSEPVAVLTHGELPAAFRSAAYGLYLSARGGSGRYRWTVEGLPPGLSVAADSGLLSGAPSDVGTYELVLRAADARAGLGDAGEAVATASIEIRGGVGDVRSEPSPAAPLILTERLPPAAVSEPYETRLAGAGQDPLRWTVTGLPAGLEFLQNGTIRGRPAAPGVARVQVGMHDALGRSAAGRLLALTVQPARARAADAGRRTSWLPLWIGYVVLALLEVAFLYWLRRRMSAKVALMLRLHGVDLIQKADGSWALNGASEHIERFKAEHRPVVERDRQYRIGSYAVLGVAILVYTVALLR